MIEEQGSHRSHRSSSHRSPLPKNTQTPRETEDVERGQRDSEDEVAAGPGPGERLPLVILAGSDRRPSQGPAAARDLHFLGGYNKGAELQAHGRPLIQELLGRVRDSGAFSTVYVAGPQALYEPLVVGLADVSIIDTDRHVGQNIKVALDKVRARHGEDMRVAVMACDILPSASELAELAADLDADRAADGEPAALAFSLVPWREDLGSSAWKPRYPLRSNSGDAPRPYLPGHLGIAWPCRLRIGLFFQIVDLAYAQRNLDFEARRHFIVSRLLRSLLWRDLLNILRLSPPTLTYTVLYHGLRAFLTWRRGDLSLEQLGYAFGAVAVHRTHFREQRERSVRVVVTPHTSFARDIDTREELEEITRNEQDSRSRPAE